MTQFVAIPSERSLLYSPKAIRLMDTFTAGEPIGRVTLTLQQEAEPGRWQDLDVQALRTADAVYSWPGLGRTANVGSRPRMLRTRIESEYYEPNERPDFEVHPYNDDNPLEPDQYARNAETVGLIPNARYPFENHLPLLRGRITLGEGGPPLAGACVEHQRLSLTADRNGDFTFPVRFPPQNTETTAPSSLNRIRVRNARGYVFAVVEVDGVAGSTYRVVRRDLVEATPNRHDATLTLVPITGGDLPAGLDTGARVSVLKFALRIDVDKFDKRLLDDHIFDVDRETGFQQFHEIAIPVLRGRVTSGGAPVANAVVQYQSLEDTTDADGGFALPVPVPPQDTHTTAVSEENSIVVRDGRGFDNALISVVGAPAGATYRVTENTRLNPATEMNFESELTLRPETGTALPADLPARIAVDILRFAVRITPDAGPTVLHDIFDDIGFQQFHQFDL